MQSSLGVPVRWLDPAEVDAANPTLAPGQTLGGTFCDDDGYITPPRNVGRLRGRPGPQRRPGVRADPVHRPGDGGRPAAGWRRRAGPDQRARWSVLTGGPKLADGRARWPGSGSRRAARGTRSPSPSRTRTCGPTGCPWCSTWPAGLYWRPGGGRPAVRDEQPGRAARRGTSTVDEAVPGRDAGAARRAGAGHRRARPAPDLGGDHRLHARPPARSSVRRSARTGRWPGSPWPAPAGTA